MTFEEWWKTVDTLGRSESDTYGILMKRYSRLAWAESRKEIAGTHKYSQPKSCKNDCDNFVTMPKCLFIRGTCPMEPVVTKGAE